MDSLALGRFLVGRCPEGAFLEYNNLGNFVQQFRRLEGFVVTELF